ncbi:J domain-containing protein [Qipengyuania marisflavi]|uniref:J domain-containing protein n=1 Tax=Qipengyuania marisflavi TaxID=2486356 RepID=A0A5S3P5K7_9SPHN|nr:J domain-containing protein [Qipengyuania marisflavi]TMM48111.1 J domain-containing protein [Qipengyuania marisflavi]
MIRIIAIVVLVSIACRWIFGKWPWDYLQSTPTREQALSKARKLLGVAPGADHREIRDAHRRIAVLVHPDKGGSKAQIQEANAARDLLLHELPYEIPETPQ